MEPSETVELNYCALERLPLSIYQEKHFHIIKTMYLKCNQLTELTPRIGLLHQLVQFFFSVFNSNYCRCIKIGNLRNLQTLDVSCNQLQSLPLNIGQMGSLQRLNLYRNKLHDLPSEIGQLKQLKSLNIASNQIRRLPEELGNCNKLDCLIAEYNDLIRLPNSIIMLSKLEYLSVSGNKITELPHDMSSMKALSVITIDNNQLSYLPAAIAKLQNLQYFSLRGNEKLHTQDRLQIVLDKRAVVISNDGDVITNKSQKVLPLVELSIRALNEDIVAAFNCRDSPLPQQILKDMKAKGHCWKCGNKFYRHWFAKLSSLESITNENRNLQGTVIIPSDSNCVYGFCTWNCAKLF
ncbi:Leucine-rich repeat-containing protein 28 [Trichoplax sp. H2]|nr:Leucine-rich repeat-containing protein 28 [Trichoplax sp. H2]|eukprot:RDD39046.1 Leucine-rich repeat-containing protein 28 [Trichoplax sp. H2]